MHFPNLIETIKIRRQSLKVNQELLSELSGISLRTLKQFESGKGNPTLKTIEKLAGALGLELTLKVKSLSSDK
ncbi:MAG: transcriptional regulator [Bacteroidetes bacterium]|nr:MAG: transcriptional regulator [Bacteroidota bacterium]